MNYIVKKACMSMLSGACCMLGSWVMKHTLDKANNTKKKRLNKEEKKGPA